jgi:hypothetical protein
VLTPRTGNTLEKCKEIEEVISVRSKIKLTTIFILIVGVIPLDKHGVSNDV